MLHVAGAVTVPAAPIPVLGSAAGGDLRCARRWVTFWEVVGVTPSAPQPRPLPKSIASSHTQGGMMCFYLLWGHRYPKSKMHLERFACAMTPAKSDRLRNALFCRKFAHSNQEELNFTHAKQTRLF